MTPHAALLRPTALLVALAIVLSGFAPTPARAVAQGNSRNGCMNQWLFNGVWRVRITKVEPLMNGSQQQGWLVSETWRNGTSRELSPADSLMKDQQLQLSGATLAPQPNRQQGLAFNTLAPSGQYSYQQIFYGPNLGVDPSNKPKALDVTFDGARLATQNKPHFTSGRYNYHYDLTCVASGKAALAEGGSTQVDATQGCMNQWMSNGVWKMRVLKVMPFPEGAAAANQGGWSVVQEWVNVTHGKVFPGGLPDIGNRVAPTNVSDEFLATKGGNNASTFNTVGGFHLGARNVPFAPGEPYTFSQLIAWNPLDPADTPTRLLVTFDVTSQNAEKLSIPVPRYRNPANFRINLACGGKVVSAPGVNALQSPPPQPASAAAPQRMASAQMPSGGRTPNVDPCAMLSAPDVASALGVGVRSLGTAQRPSPDECAWPVAARAGAPAQNVVLVMQNVPPAKPHCHGLGCLHVVQSALGAAGLPGVPGLPGLPPQFSEAFTDAQIIADLGDRAAWKDGRLTVVKADIAFQLLVHGSGSPALSTSEALARDVLDHLPSP